MNWFYTYRARIDCQDPKVIMCDEKAQEVYFYIERKGKPCSLILLCQQVSYYVKDLLDIGAMPIPLRIRKIDM